MCRLLAASGLALLFLILSLSTLSAQPVIAVYFCGSGAPGQQEQVCQGIGTLDTLCVVALNLPCWLSGIEFAIAYNPCVTWLADLNTQPVTIGATPTGLAMGWSSPQPPPTAFVCNVLFMWGCDFCDPNCCRQSISPIPHPATGSMMGSCVVGVPPTFIFQGQPALVCAWTLVEETTWGKVKALYTE